MDTSSHYTSSHYRILEMLGELGHADPRLTATLYGKWLPIETPLQWAASTTCGKLLRGLVDHAGIEPATS